MSKPPIALDRRSLFSLGGALIAASTGASVAEGAVESAAAEPELRVATAVEGTNICARLSPDGGAIAFDLYGVLWLLPREGGQARRLTDDLAEVGQPDWSPDGRKIVFQSYRSGAFQIWTINADGTGLEQLTDGPFDAREPRYSPDGSRIAFSSDRAGGRYGIFLLDPATRAVTPAFGDFKGPVRDEYEPSWSPDGRSLVYTVDHSRIEIGDLVSPHSRKTVAEIPNSSDRLTAGSLGSPAFAPDGRDVVFTAIEHGRAELRTSQGAIAAAEDVFPFRVSWISADAFLYTAGGKIRRHDLKSGRSDVVPFVATVSLRRPAYARAKRDFLSRTPRPVRGLAGAVLSPDAKSIVFRALNDLYLLKIGEKARALCKDAFFKTDPAFSPDGRRLAYATDRGGKLDIWVRDLETGAERQVTRFRQAALAPAWSPDGRRIAFLSQNGGLHVVDLASGEIRQLYADLWEPGKPSWSPDGRTIVYAAFKPYSGRFREGLSEILSVDVETGQARYEPIAEHRSLGVRGDDGPVWSPDGKSLGFIFASRLHVAPVHPDGRLAGPARALTDAASDGVSWSGDSRTLLTTILGRLALVSADGGAPRFVEHGLTWANARSRERLVIKAGRLWDGRTPELKRDVDVLIEEGVIADIRPAAGAGDHGGARVIDARDRTVAPGLIDMHTHRQMQGYGYGDREGRLWLSLGVTTTRCPGAPAYHTIEDREAIDSGARLGPRYFTTGEAIDGGRIFYNFMRPVSEPGQLALELDRVKALSYDLIKTYVRLSPAAQKKVVDWAHANGLPVTSHYAFPALGIGIDGMEHMGATSRWGYSRSVSALGRVYQDVTALFLATGAPRTPTLFTTTALLAEDRSLVDDPRVRALYPPWEYERLQKRVEQLRAIDRAPLLASLQANVEETARTLRSGGRIISGTDSPIDFNAISLHLNLRAMVRFGMTPFEALSTATRLPGEALGAPIGVAAKGALADLVVVEGDPLSRIEAIAAVDLVIKGGVPLRPQDLIAPFATASASAAEDTRRTFACAPAGESDYWWHAPSYVATARTSCCQGRCDALASVLGA